MRRVIVWSVICVCLFFGPVFGAEGSKLDRDCILFVEEGDSFIRLFGRDWVRVFQANSETADQNGQEGVWRDPNKLTTGARLFVPKGAQLTELAARRLSQYGHVQESAMEAIEKARVFVSQYREEEQTEAYRRGITLLGEAEKFAKGISCGFENYVDARRLADEALRAFAAHRELARSKLKMAHLVQEQRQRESVLRNKIKLVHLK